MKHRHFIINAKSRYQMEALVVQCGADLHVCICGGNLSHVGAIALGEAESNPARTATVSVVCAYGHRDDEIARSIAKRMAGALRCRVSVSAGIHIDDAAPSELKRLLSDSEALCTKMIQEMLLGNAD